MYARKNHDKPSKNAKESDIQLSGLSLLISQAKVNVAEKTKQSTPCKTSTPKQPQAKTSPRRRPLQTRADDLKNVQGGSHHRHQSPSPSRAHTRASSSPGAVEHFTDTSLKAKSEDSNVSTPTSSGPVYSRSHWPINRKPSGRSRHGEVHSGKYKVTVRKNENGKFFVRRSAEERSGDPERLLLDRCNLPSCPVVEGEHQLRLLNYQHNQIMKIENLNSFSSLMFLDLSDNCIETISGLDTLVSLRVLMLGRNRIKCIEGLNSTIHLDVLDLSGNQILEISYLNHLKELRVLNLSCNQLTDVSNLVGLDSLIELNLSKNNISTLSEVNLLPRLQRLFLTHNTIEKFEDMSCIINVASLSELTLEGCPLTQRTNYRYLILFRLPHLKFLDMRRVLDEEKRTAQMVMRKEEMKRQESIRLAKIKEAREKAISNAHQLWESSVKEGLDHSVLSTHHQLDLGSPITAVPLQLLATHSKFSLLSEEEEDSPCSFCESSGVPCDYCDGTFTSSYRRRISSSKFHKGKHKSSKKGRDGSKASKKAAKNMAPLELEVADSRLTYLAEVDEGMLQLFGPGAVTAAIDHSWHPQTISSIHTVGFHYVVFDHIAPLLAKFKLQFPNIMSVTFECASLHSLPQLNALGQMSGLQTLSIENEGNPVTDLTVWRLYAVYRLGPSLTFINGITVTHLERMKAEDTFGGLGQATTTLLPKYRLSSLLNTPRVKQLFLKEKGYSPNSLQRQPESQVASDVVMKAALTYNPHHNEFALPCYKSAGRNLLEKSLACVDETMKKRLVFQRLWPSIFLELVKGSLQEYANLDRHMKLYMKNLLKKHKSEDDYDKRDKIV